MRNKESPHVLLLDDDVAFGKIVQRVAVLGNVHLTHVETPRKLTWPLVFDVAVVDFELSNMTGIQFVRTMESLSTNIPAILVSSYNRLTLRDWPPSVVAFIHKSEGAQRILFSALEAHRTWHLPLSANGK